jgi:hypothetical protein
MSAVTDTPSIGPVLRSMIIVWGAVGVASLLGRGVFNLTATSIHTITSGELAWYHWVALAAWIVIMGLLHGWVIFARHYGPMVAARALHLSRHPVWWHVLLAPLFCVGLFHADRLRMATVWILVPFFMTLAILLRMYLPDPWLGICLSGVAVALWIGVLSIMWNGGVALFTGQSSGRPHLPVDPAAS